MPSCLTPPTLEAINPADVPDVLNQFSGTVGAPIVKDKTFFFVTADYTMQDRTTFLSPTLPAFVLPADGHLDYEGNYRQTLVNARVDHKFSPRQTLMVRANLDRFYDTNPNDAVAGTSAPSVARKYSRRSLTGQVNLTSVLGSTLVNEARFAYLNGDPVTLVGGGRLLDDVHACRLGALHHRSVARLGSVRPTGAVVGHAVVVARPAQRPARHQPDPSHFRRHGQRTWFRHARHVHVPQHHARRLSVN